MDLATTVKQAARSAFTSVGTLAKSVTYTTVRGTEYNPTSGSPTGRTTTNHTVLLIMTEYDESLIDGSRIQQGDLRGFVSTLDLAIVPEGEADYVTLADGSVLRVVRWKYADPAEALFEFQLRK